MRIPYEQLWYSDISRYALDVTLNNGGKPKVVYTDVLLRDDSTLPVPDMYIFGAPCQGFSTMGTQKQQCDDRFKVFEKCIQTIINVTPTCFIIENVPSINREATNLIKKWLEPLVATYKIHDSVLNTKNFGLPQNRPRLYIVGLRRATSSKGGEFNWPSPQVGVSLAEFLNLTPADGQEDELTPYVKSVIHRCADRVGINNFQTQPFCCNSGSSRTRLSVMNDCCPCLTRRCCPYVSGGFNRRLTIDECARLQGFTNLDLTTVSPSMARCLIGNAQSVNVLVAILENLLPAAGLINADSNGNGNAECTNATKYTGLLRKWDALQV